MPYKYQISKIYLTKAVSSKMRKPNQNLPENQERLKRVKIYQQGSPNMKTSPKLPKSGPRVK